MMWKIQPAKQNDAIQACSVPHFHPGNWAEVFTWQNFPALLPRSWLENLRSQESRQPGVSYEHVKNFTKDLKVR